MKITLCIDKQARNNPSSELRQYSIDIGCPLRSVDSSFDELKISTDDNNKLVGVIYRRCYVDKYGVLKKLDTEEIQELEIPEIILFEGSNYVYIKEFTNLNMKIEYLTNAEMNKYFASKVEMNTTIKQTYDEIMLSVSTKVGEDEIISKINMSPETITILANKLGLTANDVLDIIAGNEINLTTKNISINSDKFSVDKNGNLNCNDATMNNVNVKNGKILIQDTSDKNNSYLKIQNSDLLTRIGSNYIQLQQGNIGESGSGPCSLADIGQGILEVAAYDYLDENHNAIGYRGIIFEGRDGYTTRFSFSVDNSEKISFRGDGAYFFVPVYANSYNNISLESKKKNFELFNAGLELITNSDFYLYNYKSENDDDKKHIGLVIGKKYNTPIELMNRNEDSIDLYSLISACGDAIKTLNNRIIELEKQVKEMK